MAIRTVASTFERADPRASGPRLGIRRDLQSHRSRVQRKIRDAVSRARCGGHIATGLRGKYRWHPLHAPGGTGAVAGGGLRKKWWSGRPPPAKIRRDVLPDVHRIQQKRRAALLGHFAGFDPLGPQGRDPSRLQGELEQSLDKVRRYRSAENWRQILDVLAGYRRG